MDALSHLEALTGHTGTASARAGVSAYPTLAGTESRQKNGSGKQTHNSFIVNKPPCQPTLRTTPPAPAHHQPPKKFVPGKPTHNSRQISKTAYCPTVLAAPPSPETTPPGPGPASCGAATAPPAPADPQPPKKFVLGKPTHNSFKINKAASGMPLGAKQEAKPKS